ncbi:MAG: hypothetical protein ABI822_20435 [Bryobacteraceae bacterium]
MAVNEDDSQAAREERARRLREQIDGLKTGTEPAKPPKRKKSIKEQLDDASRKQGGESI